MAQPSADLFADSLPPRLRSKFTITEGGCWLWHAAVDRAGYGRVKRLVPRADGQTTAFAHRYIYELVMGNDPGPDLVMDHLCRVPACVNPWHLEPVPQVENVRRGNSGEAHRQKYARHLWCPQGHPLFGANLYLHITRRGVANKQCRICRRERDRRRRAKGLA